MSEKNSSTISLLVGFNNRDGDAFGEVYRLYYTELVYFARQLYRDVDVVATDVVHDIIIKMWRRRDLQFKTLIGIKAYIMIAIKNGFLDYIKHRKQHRKYENELYATPDYFVSEMVESETLSHIAEVVKVLPEEMAKVFNLYLDGWEMKEIADQLGKKVSTVYAQRRDAIKLLKCHLSKDKLFILKVLFWA